jgi:hypothetical protein
VEMYDIMTAGRWSDALNDLGFALGWNWIWSRHGAVGTTHSLCTYAALTGFLF